MLAGEPHPSFGQRQPRRLSRASDGHLGPTGFPGQAEGRFDQGLVKIMFTHTVNCERSGLPLQPENSRECRSSATQASAWFFDDPSNLAVVAIRPTPRVVHGPLAQSDFAPVAEWIALNEAALINFWNGTLSTFELVGSLRQIDAQR